MKRKKSTEAAPEEQEFVMDDYEDDMDAGEVMMSGDKPEKVDRQMLARKQIEMRREERLLHAAIDDIF